MRTKEHSVRTAVAICRRSGGVLLHQLCRTAWLGALLLASSLASAGQTIRVSISSDGAEANADCDLRAFSANGRFVVFQSGADNLVQDDKNRCRDVFIHDRVTRTTERVSVNSDGEEGNRSSSSNNLLGISADGRFVVFQSSATNFVEWTSPDYPEIYIRDRLNGTTELISKRPDGSPGRCFSQDPVLSLDGRWVAFDSCAPLLDDYTSWGQVYVFDRESETMARISVNSDGEMGKGDSYAGSVSSTGRFVYFYSFARNLIPNDKKPNYYFDTYRHDRDADENGVFDEPGGIATVLVSFTPEERQFDQQALGWAMTPDGRFASFAGVGDFGVGNAYVRDLQEGATTLASVNRFGNPAGKTNAQGITADARFLVMGSWSKNMVEDDKNNAGDTFVRDRWKETNTRVSVRSDGGEANRDSWGGAISLNGRFVAFRSDATNLVDGDTNDVSDIFLHDFLGCSEHIRGDSNCDGAVDFNDIDVFVLALIDEGEYVLQNLSCDWECNNDINGDGTVDFNDIDGFVECLINGGCP